MLCVYMLTAMLFRLVGGIDKWMGRTWNFTGKDHETSRHGNDGNEKRTELRIRE